MVKRVLCFYVACTDTSAVMKEFVYYITYECIPERFAIEKESRFTNGPKHFCNVLRSKACSVVNKILQKYALFAHPENILTERIQDHEQGVTGLGWRRILKLRMTPSQSARQRIFKSRNCNSTPYATL